MKKITLKLTRQEALWVHMGLELYESWMRVNNYKEFEIADQIKELKLEVRQIIFNKTK